MPSNESRLRVVIPARYGSSRLPGKPLIHLGGKPMVVRVYEVVRSALPEADIVVATDDERVMAALAEHQVPGVMTDAGHESGTDRAAEIARLRHWPAHDVVLNVQGDEPLVPADLLQAFASFCAKSEFSMGTIAVPLEDLSQIQNPNVVKLTMNAAGDAIVFSRAPIPFNRDLPSGSWPMSDYLRHVGIYAYRNDVLQRLTGTSPCRLEQIEKLEQLRALWLGISVHVMRWYTSPPHGVDTPEDVTRVIAVFEGVNR